MDLVKDKVLKRSKGITPGGDDSTRPHNNFTSGTNIASNQGLAEDNNSHRGMTSDWNEKGTKDLQKEIENKLNDKDDKKLDMNRY
ncbi:hypothetical protein ABK040_006754 [Willaertia magna]